MGVRYFEKLLLWISVNIKSTTHCLKTIFLLFQNLLLIFKLINFDEPLSQPGLQERLRNRVVNCCFEMRYNCISDNRKIISHTVTLWKVGTINIMPYLTFPKCLKSLFQYISYYDGWGTMNFRILQQNICGDKSLSSCCISICSSWKLNNFGHSSVRPVVCDDELIWS